MILLTNDQIEQIRALSETQIREQFGDSIRLYIQEYKAGEYIKYAVHGNLDESDLIECGRLITRNGSIVAKVYLDEGYG